MDWIVQETFGLPPIMDGHGDAQERVSNPALNWLRQVCIVAETEARLDEALTASGIAEMCLAHSLEIPGVSNDAPESRAVLRIGQLMGKVFVGRQSVECDGFEILKSETTQYSEERRRDETLKKYTIQRFAPNAPCCAPCA
jgi:hypothetical protein